MGKRILIVDDESDFVRLLQYRLNAAGYEVEFATRGMEALNKVRLAAPDLIVLGLMLPDLDGLTVCEILRCQLSTRTTPVIIVTAADPEATRLAMETAGARLVLNKTLDLARLESAIASLVGGKREAAAHTEDHESVRG